MTEPKPASWLDPRLAVGVAVSALAIWIAFRDVPLGRVWQALASADLWVAVVPSFACYLAALWVRVLRWRHLAAGVGELPYGAAYRATAIRFMVNNLFPFRLGEIVGPWVISREVGGSAAAWFGTVVLERAFDMAAIMGLAIFLIADRVDLAWGYRIFAFVPMLGIAALRLWPAFFVGIGRSVLTALLPRGVAARAVGLVEEIVAGLAGIRDVRGLGLVIFHTLLLWAVISPIPFLLAQRSLGVDLGSLRLDFLGATMTTVAVAAAVGLPQAPGFVGVYHAACKTLLVALGVDKDTAIAVGTLAHALFWTSITGYGLLALRRSGTSLAETLRGARRSSAA
jgi:uncharacterized membrane protein YbhN (UPF0104 family)